jgi:MFS family permease
MRSYGLNFWLLCLSSFLFFSSFNMIIPELPDFMRSMGGEKFIGLHIALFTLTAGLSRPFSGKLTDKWGRVPVMIVGAVVTGCVALVYPFVLNIYGFLLLRLAHGFSTGFKPTGTAAYVADVVPSDRRGEAMGIASFFSMIGMMIGYAVSSKIVAAFTLDGLFYISACIAVLSIVILLGMKETLEQREKFSLNLLKINWGDVYEPSALRPATVMMLNCFCFGVVVSLFPDFSVSLGILDKGLYFVYFSGASLISRVIGGRLSDRFGRVPIIMVALLIVATGSVLTGISTTPAMFFTAGVVFGAGYGLASPSLFAWVIDLASPEARGKALSTVFLALEIGIGCGALLSGIAYQSDVSRFPWIFGGAAFLSVLAFIYLVVTRPKKHA